MPLKKTGFDKIVRQLQNYKGGILVVFVGLVTVATERLVEVILFRCPCGDKDSRLAYADLFILAPCVILFTMGVAFNPRFWKLCTGSREGCKPKPGFDECCSCTCCNFFWFALVAPIIWLVLVLIDGDYFACADASTAYENNANEPCKPGESPITSAYRESKQRSQIIGMSLACIIPLAIFVIYFSVKACSSMTYHQEKISSKCKQKLEEILVAEFENVVAKPVSSVGLQLGKLSKLSMVGALVNLRSFNGEITSSSPKFIVWGIAFTCTIYTMALRLFYLHLLLVRATSPEKQQRQEAENWAHGIVEKYKKDKKENKLEAVTFWINLQHNLERGNYDLSQTNLKTITSKKLKSKISQNDSTTTDQSTNKRRRTQSV